MSLASDLSRREREVMDIVYGAESITAEKVRGAMAAPPSNAAVRTVLRSLVVKGHLRHSYDGPRYVYSPTVPRQQARRSAIRHLLNTFFGGSVEGAMAALLELDSTELTEVAAAPAGVLRGHEGALRGQIGALRGQTSALRQQRTSLARLDENSARLALLDDEIAGHEEQIRVLEGKLTIFDLEARVAAVQDRIAGADVAGKIAEVETQIAELGVAGRIGEIEGQIIDLKMDDKLEALASKLEALRVDQRIGAIDAALEVKADDLRRILDAFGR